MLQAERASLRVVAEPMDPDQLRVLFAAADRLAMIAVENQIFIGIDLADSKALAAHWVRRRDRLTCRAARSHITTDDPRRGHITLHLRNWLDVDAEPDPGSPAATAADPPLAATAA